MVVDIFGPHTWEAEIGGTSWVWDHPDLQSPRTARWQRNTLGKQQQKQQSNQNYRVFLISSFLDMFYKCKKFIPVCTIIELFASSKC